MDGDRFESSRIDALRVAPHSIDAEQAVLGGLMLNERALAKIADWLVEEDFYRKDHRLIFRAITDMSVKNQPVDTVTMAEWFESNGLADLIGGSNYILQLGNMTPSAANIVAYAEIVRERSRLRSLIDAGTTIASEAYAQGADAALIAATGAQALSKLQTSRLRGGLRAAKELLRSWYADLHRRYEVGDKVTGLRTPWNGLDLATHGLQNADLIILAGRPNMGKSVAGFQIAATAARAGIRSAVFSLESAEASVIRRCVSALASVPHDWLMAPSSDEDGEQYWPKISAAMLELSEAPLVIDDSPGLDVHQIRARALRAHLQAPLGLVVVDHLHIVRRKGENEIRELGEISRTLKSLAKELNCPVLALAQLNRKLTDRVDKHPTMTDLRASGEVEQDADLILFLHREDYYDAKHYLKGVVEIEIGKGRDIRTGQRVHLANAFEFMRLDNWEGPLPQEPAKETKQTTGFKKQAKKIEPRADVDG